MRFVHMADIHFDCPFRVLASKNNLADVRRLEQREAFKKGIEYIKKENIPFLFISGDLYEQEYIRESTIEYINNLFKEIPDTKIFISPGNHDPYLINSFYNTFNWNKNVTIFDGKIKRIELEEVDIYGYGFSDFYCNNSGVDEIEIKNKEKINILITHGSLDASKKQDLQYNPINSLKLKNIGFDYVALGHIHKANFNNNENNFIYPGSLISFGFDELGEHGILDIKINKKNNLENKLEENKKNNLIIKNKNENNKNNYLIKDKKITEIEFIKIENEKFAELNINIDKINSEEEIIEEIKKIDFDNDKFYKIILTGNKNLEIDTRKICKLTSQDNILKIKDHTQTEYDIYKLSEQKNLKGMFIKNLLDKMSEMPDEKMSIQKAIEIGLKMFE